MIILGADHGGFALKEKAKQWLSEWGFQAEDVGAAALDPADDYPVFAFQAVQRIASNAENLGILLCRSGGGMAIAANRVKGIRAVECFDARSAAIAREKNNANVLALSADWLNEDQAKEIIKTFLNTPFSGAERHVRRIAMLDKA